jgi:hypothetical protein
MAGAWPDYHEYTLFDWNHILAEGPHTATLLGENDDVACATLSALFTFMLPILVQAFTRTKRKHLLAVYFALAFVYIRYYQPVETFPRWFHWGPDHKTVSRGAFYTMVVPIIKLCAVSLRELKWDDRLEYTNHHPLADRGVLWMVDTFPQLVFRPMDALTASLLYAAGKYCEVMYKVELITDLNGVCLHISFGLGTTGDGTQFEEFASEHRCYRNEYGYGDTAYSGCPDVLTNYEPIPQGTRPSIPITPTEKAFNENMNRVRARIEHSVAEHRRGRMMFNTKFRGDPALLKAAHFLIAHANRRARRVPGPKYDLSDASYGPHDSIY